MEILSGKREGKRDPQKIQTTALVNITPREFASAYAGKISEREYSVLSLFWSYRNTFRTFFEICDLEAVTYHVARMVEKKPYRFDRTFVRNGLRFTPSFDKFGSEASFLNTIFDVEAVMDMGKNLSLNLEINKSSWDRLSVGQRETIQKNFGFTGCILSDRVIVWNSFYRQDWMKKEFEKSEPLVHWFWCESCLIVFPGGSFASPSYLRFFWLCLSCSLSFFRLLNEPETGDDASSFFPAFSEICSRFVTASSLGS